MWELPGIAPGARHQLTRGVHRWQLCKGLGPGEDLAPPLRCQPLTAARGSLAPVGLLWLCLAPAALLKLHQPQSILVVEPGASVEIGCKADKDLQTKFALSWYRRSKDGPDLLLDGESRTKGRFSCRYGRNNLTLHIASAQPDNTSLYLCACCHINYCVFGSGTMLLVGDSWRAGSWVWVLAPRGAPQAPPSLVCAVGATAGPVLVSWLGGPRGVLGLGGGTGPLVSPMGMARGPGGLCEVNFNTSGPPVRRSVELHGATGSCMTRGTWVLAGAGVLLLLSLCLSIRHLRRPTLMGKEPGMGRGWPATMSPAVPQCPVHLTVTPPPPCPSIPDPPPSSLILPQPPPSPWVPSIPMPGTPLPALSPPSHQPSTPMPPVSREDEGGLTYAQLSFAAPAGPTP
ncbi:uncharacterized protein LOC142036208 [Buteo buteo]|uniref:uncharacterized protein LOC142036208 n=1 Tax=Buteo buteo TaxID=30397 RepID=UPI003EBCA92A